MIFYHPFIFNLINYLYQYYYPLNIYLKRNLNLLPIDNFNSSLFIIYV